jgi:O-antigen/teichoic acid export membrane protein
VAVQGAGLTAGPAAQGGSVRPEAARVTDSIRQLLSRPAVYGSLIPGMSVLNALAGLAVPTLITPTVFAQYTLVVTFFQYGLIFDLGASQLADRAIPAFLGRDEAVAAEEFGQHLLWFRIMVAAGSFALAAIAMALLAAADRLPFDLWAGLLSAFAGLIYMLALGPACIHRARAERRNYAMAIATLSGGLVVARVGGLALGGITGCFVALSIWYLVFAALFMRLMPPRRKFRPTVAQVNDLALRGAPLFVTSFFWAFYVTSNRWIACGILGMGDFVPFAFGANILTLLVGALGGLSALWYPAILQDLARPGRGASHRVARDITVLIVAASVFSASGAVVAQRGVHLLFPHFEDSVPIVRIFLAAMPALALSSWLMPVSLSAGRRPWVDGVVLYPVATAVLTIGIPLLYVSFGVGGAAWASAASALVLTAMQLVLLVDANVFGIRESLAIETMVILVTIALSSLGLFLQ